jgi:hypothetical protein
MPSASLGALKRNVLHAAANGEASSSPLSILLRSILVGTLTKWDDGADVGADVGAEEAFFALRGDVRVEEEGMVRAGVMCNERLTRLFRYI